MTVRQVYYQLVSGKVIENTRSQYSAVSNALRDARKDGTIPWDWIEDRLRRPRAVAMWDDPAHFSEVAHQYRRDVWVTQPEYLEVWLEKDALSGIFEDVLRRYGITLQVGRGYDGWDSIRNAAARYINSGGIATVLYFGDFDPSGEDMVRSLRERLGFFEACPEVVKCALNGDDVRRYNLPPDFAKKTDTRAAAFIQKHGDVSVELDALPVQVLRTRLVSEIEKRLDLDALTTMRRIEAEERSRLVQLMATA